MDSKEKQRNQNKEKGKEERGKAGKEQRNIGKGIRDKRLCSPAGILGILGMLLIIIMIIKVVSDFNEVTSLDDTMSDVVVGEEGKVTTISSISLKKVFEISELSTSQYTYNAIARAYDEDGISVKYYVAYEGKVSAGIDFEKLKYDIDEEQKTIMIVIPEIEFHDKTVDPGTLKYIFKDSKSETETIHQEAFKVCEKDLEERIEQESALKEQARQNTIAVVQALVEPWVKQIDDGYKVIIQ